MDYGQGLTQNVHSLALGRLDVSLHTRVHEGMWHPWKRPCILQAAKSEVQTPICRFIVINSAYIFNAIIAFIFFLV